MIAEDKRKMIAFYKELYENSAMPISIVDKTFSIIWSNHQVERQIGRIFRTGISRSLDEELKNEIFSLASDGRVKTVTLDGIAEFPVNLSFAPLYTKDSEKKLNFEYLLVTYITDEYLKRPDTSALETIFAEIKRNLNDISVYRNAILSRLSEAGYDPGKEVYKFFDKILNSGCTILKIIDDFSYYTGVIGEKKPEKELFIDCGKYLDGIFHAIKSILNRKEKDIRYIIDVPNGKYIFVEPSKLDRVILSVISIIEKNNHAELNTVKATTEDKNLVIEFNVDYNSDATSFIDGIKMGVMEKYNIDDVSKFILRDCLGSTGGQADFEIRENGNVSIYIRFETKDVPEKIKNDLTSFVADKEVLVDLFSDINIGLSDIPY